MRTPVFDYKTKRIEDATTFEWIIFRVIQWGARSSSLWGYRGFGACCRILQKLVPGRTLTIMLDNDSAFSVPFADGYWSMLLGSAEIYEPEIDSFLKNLAGENYTLIDGGANYGYWSVLASGKTFGSQRVIAIEPSSMTFAILKNNMKLNRNRFDCIKKAVGARTGTAYLSGHKHEARAVADTTDGDGESVEMLTLDSLIDDDHISPTEKVVIKLDVEGLEIAALSGSEKLLAGDCIVICEDHGTDLHHTVSRHFLEKTELKLFCYDIDAARFISISQASTLDRVKRFRNRGYNVFATASPYWEEQLLVKRDEAFQPTERNQQTRKALVASLARGYLLTLI